MFGLKKKISGLKQEILYRYTIASVHSRRSVSSSSHPRFLFLVAYPEAWNSVKLVYEEICSREDAEALIIAIPRMKDGVVVGENDAACFFENHGLGCIEAYDENEGEWCDLAQLMPSHVVYVRPYETEYPTEYRPYKVALYARTCLFPYAYLNSDPAWYFSIEYGKSFMRGINYVCSGQASTNVMLRTAYRKAIERKRLCVSDAGYPRFELVERCTDWYVPGEPLTVLWTPRWAVRDNADCTTFFKYIERLVKFVVEHDEVRLICRPHPLALRNFVQEGCMTLAEVDEFKRFFREAPRFRLDEGKDYLESFRESDILISDASAIVIEYFLSGKPIIYTGEMGEVSEEVEAAYRTLYQACSWDEIAAHLNELMLGIDKDSASRAEAIERINPKSDTRASVAIVNELIEEWKLRE